MLREYFERHVHLNRQRLATYEALKTEVVLYPEAMSTSNKPPVQQDVVMDTSSFAKGGQGKSKGKLKDSRGKGKRSSFPSSATKDSVPQLRQERPLRKGLLGRR
jgi:hypothetical protein